MNIGHLTFPHNTSVSDAQNNSVLQYKYDYHVFIAIRASSWLDKNFCVCRWERQTHKFSSVSRSLVKIFALLAAWFMLISFLSYSLTLNMEATCSSAASVDFQLTIRRCIPGDRTLDITFIVTVMGMYSQRTNEKKNENLVSTYRAMNDVNYTPHWKAS